MAFTSCVCAHVHMWLGACMFTCAPQGIYGSQRTTCNQQGLVFSSHGSWSLSVNNHSLSHLLALQLKNKKANKNKKNRLVFSKEKRICKSPVTLLAMPLNLSVVYMVPLHRHLEWISRRHTSEQRRPTRNVGSTILWATLLLDWIKYQIRSFTAPNSLTGIALSRYLNIPPSSLPLHGWPCPKTVSHNTSVAFVGSLSQQGEKQSIYLSLDLVLNKLI